MRMQWFKLSAIWSNFIRIIVQMLPFMKSIFTEPLLNVFHAWIQVVEKFGHEIRECMLLVKLFNVHERKSMHAMRMTSFNLWWWRWKWNKCINIHFIRLQCLRSDPISMALLVFACNKTQLCHHAVWNANESRFVLLIWPQSIANRKSHQEPNGKNRTA